ncbi:hypothetical protein GALMADRAFT_552432 [Galerina marginata CBS 339.88]|uniref:Uncharacterized protein n=1 Tax=Galerina marginata (strain CBS 339.88) TaxID=685588 RepID=A0A067SWQ5_GALM3|nr:hypothetical protein GALMADRAFT_552432 [Galerina marginata CBS 339.88]
MSLCVPSLVLHGPPLLHDCIDLDAFMMATYTPTITPRLRMTRHSPVHYDRSTSQIASTSQSGPSRLPDFSQLVDVNLNDMAMSEASDQPSSSKLSTPSTVTRSENPAAVLRALLSRLPPDATTPTQSHPTSQQYASERESDYDMSEHTNATPSMAQESLKHLFSKARRNPGDTPQKSRPRRNSFDTSEVDASPGVEKERADNKGKRRSLSDDEIEPTNQSSSRNRLGTRSRTSHQPVTMEFLRDRFSNSHVSPSRPQSPTNIHNSSNETATILRDLGSSQATPPAATSTPQQSLRMSFNLEFHPNLLDQDTEMQNAIQGLGSYEESSSVDRSMSPPPIMRKRLTENNADVSTHPNGTSNHLALHRPLSQSSMNSNQSNSFRPPCSLLLQ